MADLYRKTDLVGKWSFDGWTYECVTTEAQVRALQEKAARMPFFGFDTESDGPLLVQPKWTKKGKQKHKDFINVYRSQMVGFSLAFPDRTAYYVPIGHRAYNAPYQPALALLRMVSLTPGWAHNLQHELVTLHQQGLPGDHTLLRDSQVSCWLANMHDGNGKYGLKELTKNLFNYEQITFEGLTKGANFGVLDPTGEEAVRYACDDAIAALLLGIGSEPVIQSWGLKDWYLDVEMPFVRVLRHMTDTGIPIDRTLAQKLGDDLSNQASKAAVKFRAQFDADPASPKQLQTLFDRGIWPTEGVKRGKTGYSTDASTIDHFSGYLPDGPGKEAATLLLTIRECSKASSTYTTNLVVLADQYPDGRLHPSYHQTGTVTGRLSSSYPNGQNMPSRSDVAKSIMTMFAADEGMTFGSADYSQIDLRVLSHFAGGVLQKGYQDGTDVHQATADLVGCDRNTGKTINFAKVYGAGAKKLASTIGCEVDEAKRFMRQYEENVPEVDRLVRRVVEAAYDRGYVKTLAGRRGVFDQMPQRDRALLRQKFRAVDEGKLTMDDLFSAWSDERKSFNLVCQGGASDIVKKAMVDLYKVLPAGMRIQTQIHDDIRWETAESNVESMELVRATMEAAWPTLRVPLVADPKMGKTWRDLK